MTWKNTHAALVSTRAFALMVDKLARLRQARERIW